MRRMRRLLCLGCVAVSVHFALLGRYAQQRRASLSATPPPLPGAGRQLQSPPPPPPPQLPGPSSAAASLAAASGRPVPARGPSKVARLIHQSWRDDGFPKAIFNWRWQQGLLDLNPDWQLMKWTDASARRLIATHYAWFLPVYDAYPSYIQRCDAARYFIVYHHGGVYADLDIECFRPFAPVVGGARVVFSYKQGVNVTRGLANAIFASEARHPFWTVVFELLANRSAAGAAAATHVDVVRSTGPGLLREAVQLVAGQGRLAALGVRLLHSRYWHPIMPEQKRGRDSTAETAAAINASHCYHHFVSSWMAHDKEKHADTDVSRGAGEGGKLGAASAGAALPVPKVPVGQSVRTVNPWKSYQLHDREDAGPEGRGGGPGRAARGGAGGKGQGRGGKGQKGAPGKRKRAT